MRDESSEKSDEFRVDLERAIVDPEYRRRVLVRLRAEAAANASPVAALPPRDA